MSPLAKYDTIVPSLEINEIRLRDIDPDVHADSIPFVVPKIGMYIRINVTKTDFIYLRIWSDSVTFCERGHFFWITLYNK